MATKDAPERAPSSKSDLLTNNFPADRKIGENLTFHQLYAPLWKPEQVAERLNVSVDWVRDHSSRKKPRLPVIRLGGGPGRAGVLRYRPNKIEEFVEEMERRSDPNSPRL